MKRDNILLKIESILDDLRPSEQKVARYILSNPQKVTYQTVNEVASNSGVSDASVMRFIKSLNLQGFQELKLALANTSEETTKKPEIKEITADSSIAEIKNNIQNNFNLSINNTDSLLEEENLQQAVDYILEAKNIFIFGAGASGIMAQLLSYKLLRLGIRTNSISDSHLQSMYASLTGESNLIIGLSHSGSTKDTVDALQLGHEAGADTICITDHIKSPIAEYSDVLLSTYAKKDPLGFSQGRSSVSQCYIIEVLCACLFAQMPEAVKESRQKTAEAVLNKLY